MQLPQVRFLFILYNPDWFFAVCFSVSLCLCGEFAFYDRHPESNIKEAL